MKIFHYSATENTFFFTTEEEFAVRAPIVFKGVAERKKIAALICSHYGSGADGFVIVKKCLDDSAIDFEWDFYNKDGSSAEMCGNASRCMALFAREVLHFKKSLVSFRTLAGVVQVSYSEKQGSPPLFRVRMPEYRIQILWQTEKWKEKDVRFCLINAGVPHAVIRVPSLEKTQLLPLVQHFRFKSEFGAAGANVSFFCKGKSGFEGVTFERGVEGFTPSCGTGVVSMSIAIFNHPDYSWTASPKNVKIYTPGGELEVELDQTNTFCWLTGPAILTEVVEVLPKG